MPYLVQLFARSLYFFGENREKSGWQGFAILHVVLVINILFTDILKEFELKCCVIFVIMKNVNIMT